jgi:WD40 repeat protein
MHAPAPTAHYVIDSRTAAPWPWAPGGGFVSLRDTATGEAVGAGYRHQGWIRSLAFSPDGKTLATASEDTTALIWDVAAVMLAKPAAVKEPVPP